MRSFKHKLVTSLLLMVAGLWSSLSSAQIYLDWDGIPGTGTNAAFAGLIKIDTFEWGLLRAIDLTGGPGGIGTPYSSEVQLTKKVDIASPALAAKFLQGAPENLIIRIARPSGGTEEEMVRLELCGVVLAQLATNVADGFVPAEVLSMAFTSFELTYFGLDGKSGGVSGSPVTWDFGASAPGAGCNP